MAVDIVFIGIGQCGAGSISTPNTAQDGFLGLNRCGDDPSPTPSNTPSNTPSPSPTASVSPSPSTSPSQTPSYTPTPSNLGVQFSVYGSSNDIGTTCYSNILFTNWVSSAESSLWSLDNCGAIPTRFYTDETLTSPFNGQDKYYTLQCPVGSYMYKIFPISAQGIRGSIIDQECLPYPSPTPTSSVTPSITPSPSQTLDPGCAFTFVIEDPPDGAQAVTIYNLNTTVDDGVCTIVGTSVPVYVANNAAKNNLVSIGYSAVGVSLYTDSTLQTLYTEASATTRYSPNPSIATSGSQRRKIILISGGVVTQSNDILCT